MAGLCVEVVQKVTNGVGLTSKVLIARRPRDLLDGLWLVGSAPMGRHQQSINRV
jgi:hypothetical protein